MLRSTAPEPAASARVGPPRGLAGVGRVSGWRMSLAAAPKRVRYEAGHGNRGETGRSISSKMRDAGVRPSFILEPFSDTAAA